MDINNLDDLRLQQLMAQATQEKCLTCGGMIFDQAIVINRISKILMAAQQDSIIPQPVFICRDCNTPYGFSTPEESSPQTAPESPMPIKLTPESSSGKSDNIIKF